MKKFLSIIILSIIFISATLPCAFADAFDNEVCYVSEDESTIEYNNKTYILIDTQDEYVLSDDSLYYMDENVIIPEFIDKQDETKYYSFDIYFYEEQDILEVSIEYSDSYDEEYEDRYYVEESKYGQACDFIGNNGELTYFINAYSDELIFLTEEEKKELLNFENNTKTLKYSQIATYDTLSLSITNESKLLAKDVGEIYFDSLEDNPEVYYILYSEYDETYFDDSFFSPGSFKTIYIHKINNEKLAQKIIDSYNDYDIFGDLLGGREITDQDIFIKLLIIFVCLPIVVIAISVMLIIFKKLKGIYRNILIVISGASALIVICYIGILLLL